LPVGVLIALIVMRHQGINANIMSLGGIAIAIGAMVDAAVVMIENAHKRVEAWHARILGRCCEGRALEGHDRCRRGGRAGAVLQPDDHHPVVRAGVHLAGPGRTAVRTLAFTKTYAMAAAAGLAVTLVPVLMGYWIRGPLPAEQRNPLNRGLIRVPAGA
jgi:Cu(I)/Ag(I) efflux system membrane protein CusA/SilA